MMGYVVEDELYVHGLPGNHRLRHGKAFAIAQRHDSGADQQLAAVRPEVDQLDDDIGIRRAGSDVQARLKMPLGLQGSFQRLLYEAEDV